MREVLRVLAAEPYRVLDPRQSFVDERERIELTREDVARAAETGSFRHPYSGELVHDWPARIESWYEAGKVLDEVFPVDTTARQTRWILG
ncbi:MAG: hypothetical protein KIT58_00895 [Planctomycetota bacterium]|nr:hypothetical protein [Planctomycetota bacterium]